MWQPRGASGHGICEGALAFMSRIHHSPEAAHTDLQSRGERAVDPRAPLA